MLILHPVISPSLRVPARQPAIVPFIRTRFYLPSSGAAAVSPGFDAGWEDTSIGSRLKTDVVKIASAMTTLNFADLDSTDRDILFRQWVSAPLNGAQTVPAGLVAIQARARELVATQDMFLSWLAKVVSNDGSTVRGTIVAIQRDGTELSTTLTNRGDRATGAAVSALDGDRFVFEVGIGGDPLVSHDTDLSVGDDSASDLPEDDAEIAAFNPWIELPGSYVFGADVAGGLVPRKLLIGVGI